MLRRLVVVGAILIAGCGSQSESQGGPDEPGGPVGGSIPLAALSASTTYLKVVLKTSQLVHTPVTVYDAASDTFSEVPCGGDGDCSAFPGASCIAARCATTSSVNAVFYARNLARGAATGIGVPCDGRLYTAEVYGAADSPSAGAPRPIVESHISVPFTMPTSCVAPAVDWASAAPSVPSLEFPPIYAGLGAPYDTFTVRVRDLAYPWAGDSWTLTHGGQLASQPTVYGGANAVFASPATPSPLTFTGSFRLHRSILVAEDAATPWELTVTESRTPVETGGVPFP